MASTPNRWWQVADDYWMSQHWDVWLQWGVWWASFYVGRRIAREFPTAMDAMRFVDETDFDDGKVYW